MKKKSGSRACYSILILLFAAIAAYSGRQVWKIQKNYAAEAALHAAVMEYKPRADEIVNQGVIDLKVKYPDVAGWLNVPGTGIDYPFVHYGDNDRYLRHDLDGNYALAGTLFMDCRCEPDFSSRNTILYGHHMKNGSMFGTLKAFADKDFFDKNTRGTIFLPHERLQLEFFAYLVVKSTEQRVYGELDLEYVRQNARQYRDAGLTSDGRIVTLSTCAYEFDEARMVLLARLS